MARRRRMKATGNGRSSAQRWLRDRRFRRNQLHEVNEFRFLMGLPELTWEENFTRTSREVNVDNARSEKRRTPKWES